MIKIIEAFADQKRLAFSIKVLNGSNQDDFDNEVEFFKERLESIYKAPYSS